MCLLWAIVNSNKDRESNQEGVLSLKEMSTMYGNWVNSAPFDIGGATFSAFGKLKKDVTDY